MIVSKAINMAKEITDLFIGIEVGTLKIAGRYAVPVEDGLILFKGYDFDGNIHSNSSRMASFGFIVLEMVQVGKLIKIYKAGKLASFSTKSGSKYILRKYGKEISQDVFIDFCCQYVVNILKEFDKNESTNIMEVFAKSFDSFQWDYRSTFNDVVNSLLYKDNELMEISMTCLKEFSLALDKGMNLEDCCYNCIIELGARMLAKGIMLKDIPWYTTSKREKFLKMLQDNIGNNSLGYRLMDDLLRTRLKR